MGQVIWTEPALEDVRRIVEYIAFDSPAYAESEGARIVITTRQLASFPWSGRIVPEYQDENIRELICGTYRIMYVIRENACYVLAVIHTRRDLDRALMV